MEFHTFPKALHCLESVSVLLHSENNSILYKRLQNDVLNTDILTVSHAIVFVINGKVEVEDSNGKLTVAENGEMIFMPRDSYIVSDYLKNSQDLEVFLLFFDHEIALSFLGDKSLECNASEGVCTLKSSKNVYYFFETLQKMKFTNKSDKALLTLKILECLHLVMQENENKFIDTLYVSERYKQKRNISSLMLEHFEKNLTVSDFASLSGMSLSTFNREFKQQYGTTPKQWLIEKKMNRAHEFLSQGQSVTQVAFDVGYLNVSNFIKAYKSFYGKTPKSMQKNMI